MQFPSCKYGEIVHYKSGKDDWANHLFYKELVSIISAHIIIQQSKTGDKEEADFLEIIAHNLHGIKEVSKPM